MRQSFKEREGEREGERDVCGPFVCKESVSCGQCEYEEKGAGGGGDEEEEQEMGGKEVEQVKGESERKVARLKILEQFFPPKKRLQLRAMKGQYLKFASAMA